MCALQPRLHQLCLRFNQLCFLSMQLPLEGLAMMSQLITVPLCCSRNERVGGWGNTAVSQDTPKRQRGTAVNRQQPSGLAPSNRYQRIFQSTHAGMDTAKFSRVWTPLRGADQGYQWGWVGRTYPPPLGLLVHREDINSRMAQLPPFKGPVGLYVLPNDDQWPITAQGLSGVAKTIRVFRQPMPA